MNSIRRLYPAFLIVLLSLFFTMGVGLAQDNNDPQDDRSQAAPPQVQSSDQPSADDQYGANDEREAEGQAVPAPGEDAPSQSAQPPMSENLPGPPSEAQENQNTPDPPARAARLQYFTGSVSIQPQGTGDWANAELNRPLTNSDNIWADKNSRAEISVGSGLIRIGSETSLTLTRVAEDMVQLQLHQGALNLHVRRLYNDEVYEVDTANQAFTVSKPGDYRFDVDPNADTTQITVWRGEGQAAGSGPAVTLRDNEEAKFSGNAISGQVHAAGEPDGFDDWARSRDERMDHSQSARYVSPDVPGYEDLDEYGTWKDTSDYGEVWVPSSVAVGWAPYRYGHWIWVAPWGWTWVDDAPWGYAPFHYGRWVYWGGYWGWAPGPLYVRPYYAPALVAWFGGPGFGVGFGFGGGFGYGWCPLGFGEPFVPWYHVSRGYFGRVNITNTRITNVRITNVYNNNYLHNHPGRPGGGSPYGRNNVRYANMHSPNGFTAVSRNTLVNGQQVGRNMVRVSPNQMSRMSPTHSLAASPSRSAVLGSSRARITPPQRSFARPTMSNASNASIAARGNGGFRGGASAGTFNRPMANRQGSPSGIERGPIERSPTMSRSVPRPPSATTSRGAEPQFGNRSMNNRPSGSQPQFGNRSMNDGRGSNQAMARGENSVPRPPSAMSRGYSGQESRGSFGGRNEPSYGSGDRGTMSRPEPSYGRAPYGGGPTSDRGAYSRPSPNYDGGSYGRPSYGGGRSTPSYGGGNYGGRAPSYGGGRAPSYGGGGHASSGGGGGHSGGGYSGGGHASSGGGGGGHSGGGGHGGRH